MKKYTANTIDTFHKLYENLDTIKSRGYSIDDREYDEHLRCVAAPVFDYSGSTVYALSLAGPASRMDDTRMESIAADLKRVCEKVSEKLGNKHY